MTVAALLQTCLENPLNSGGMLRLKPTYDMTRLYGHGIWVSGLEQKFWAPSGLQDGQDKVQLQKAVEVRRTRLTCCYSPVSHSCPICMSHSCPIHVPFACPTHVPFACPICMSHSCPICMSHLHVPFACPTHVPFACPICMSHSCPICMSHLHVPLVSHTCAPKKRGQGCCQLVLRCHL